MQKVHLSQKIVNVIDAELKRTRLSPISLDMILRKTLGSEYSFNYISAMYKGRRVSIPAQVWEDIQAVIRSLPDAPKSSGGRGTHAKPILRHSFIPLTKAMADELNAQFERVGRTYKLIINRCPNEFKELYADANVTNWRRRSVKNVPERPWNALLMVLKSLPDIQQPPQAIKKDIPISERAEPKKKYLSRHEDTIRFKGKYLAKGEGLLLISEDDINAIRFHRKRTGVSYSALLKGWKLCPQGLHGRMISSWVSVGGVQKAKPAFIRLVVSAYETLPDK